MWLKLNVTSVSYLFLQHSKTLCDSYHRKTCNYILCKYLKIFNTIFDIVTRDVINTHLPKLGITSQQKCKESPVFQTHDQSNNVTFSFLVYCKEYNNEIQISNIPLVYQRRDSFHGTTHWLSNLIDFFL